MAGWISEFQQQYHLVVYRYEPIAQGFWLETDRGTAVLYTLPDAYLPKAEWIAEVYRQMYPGGNLLPILPNRERDFITAIGERSFYLIKWPSRESEWMDYKWLGECLARFHRLSGEWLATSRNRFRGAGTWPKVWKQKLQQLKKYHQTASQRIGSQAEDPFDSFFLENYAYLSHLGWLSLSYLQDANYPLVCEETERFGKLAYTHFGHEQFVITQQGRVFFTDPFAWVEDMRVRDIGQFIKSDVREYGWNPQHIGSFLSGYHSVAPLLPEEFTVMYAMFLLPGRMVKKAESLYASPSLFAGSAAELELFRDETAVMTPDLAYLELSRNELLLREFPGFVEDVFDVVIPRVI